MFVEELKKTKKYLVTLIGVRDEIRIKKFRSSKLESSPHTNLLGTCFALFVMVYLCLLHQAFVFVSSDRLLERDLATCSAQVAGVPATRV
jgi:hypothetical protein